MEKNKNLKTILDIVAIICASMVLVFTLFWVNTNGIANAGQVHNPYSLWTTDQETMTTSVNWKLAGIYLAVLLVAFGITLFDMIKYTIPQKNKVALTFNIIAIVAFVAVIIGLFIPTALSGEKIQDEDFNTKIAVVTQVLLFGGIPMALVSVIANKKIATK